MTDDIGGYGSDHRRLRRMWAQRIRNNWMPPCSRCGYPVLPGQAWDLDHTDDRTGYLGPAHAHCNRSAGAYKKIRQHQHRQAHSEHRSNPTTQDWA